MSLSGVGPNGPSYQGAASSQPVEKSQAPAKSESVAASWGGLSLKTAAKAALFALVLMGLSPGAAGASVGGSGGGNSPEDLCQNDTLKYICNNSLGIPRNEMPQVPTEVRDNLLDTLRLRNIIAYHTTLPASDLVPIQGEMSLPKVKGMVDAAKAGTFNPCEGEILVSRGTEGPYNNETVYRVVDGHHRWAACDLIDGDQKVVVVAMQVHEFLQTVNLFPGVTHTSL